VDEKVMYNPHFDANPPETGQALSIMINEIDLDEDDSQPFPTMDESAELNPDLVQYEVPPQPIQPSQFPPPQIVERQMINRDERSQLQPHPTPISLESRQQSILTQNAHGNFPGQHVVHSTQLHSNPLQPHKLARRQAHALRLQCARSGQQIIHAFASARSIRIHRKDLMPPPDFWHQLKRHPERKGFRSATEAEIKSLKEKKTFELVDYPEGKQVLPLKWVFTYKFDNAGYLVRYKARICGRGDLQHHESHDIYAATGTYRSFRILMALVRAFQLLCHQIDFKNAFTNADMDEEIYTTCPPGYGMPGKVWKLRKALYGLRKLDPRSRDIGPPTW